MTLTKSKTLIRKLTGQIEHSKLTCLMGHGHQEPQQISVLMIRVRNRGEQWRLLYHIAIHILAMIVCMEAIWPKLKSTVRYRNTMEQSMQSIWQPTQMTGDDDECTSDACKAFHDKQDLNNTAESTFHFEAPRSNVLGRRPKIVCCRSLFNISYTLEALVSEVRGMST